jgi:NAD(P)-dependent dehydrogenase (short-subunit alcohol dehydrogenase family)
VERQNHLPRRPDRYGKIPALWYWQKTLRCGGQKSGSTNRETICLAGAGKRQSEAHFDAQRAATILGRGADPDEIVSALRYLVAAPSVTGQILCVDGGQHLGWRTPDILGRE